MPLGATPRSEVWIEHFNLSALPFSKSLASRFFKWSQKYHKNEVITFNTSCYDQKALSEKRFAVDPILTAIESVRPSVLKIITMRTETKGLIAGQIRLGVGAAHAAKMNPRWVGLPHFIEHMIGTGASRHYPEGADKFLRDKLYIFPNAYTNLTETRYFTGIGVGQVLPARRFWDAFEATVDGVFFSKFDLPTMEKERKRILEEISQVVTPLRLDNVKRHKLQFGADYLDLNTTGSKEQIESYTRSDLVDFHRETYNLRNTCIAIVGDVDH